MQRYIFFFIYTNKMKYFGREKPSFFMIDYVESMFNCFFRCFFSDGIIYWVMFI